MLCIKGKCNKQPFKLAMFMILVLSNLIKISAYLALGTWFTIILPFFLLKGALRQVVLHYMELLMIKQWREVKFPKSIKPVTGRARIIQTTHTLYIYTCVCIYMQKYFFFFQINIKTFQHRDITGTSGLLFYFSLSSPFYPVGSFSD